MPFNWVCPHCNRAQTVTDSRLDISHRHININGLAEGSIGLTVDAIGCANPDCQRVTVVAELGEDVYRSVTTTWSLIRSEPLVRLRLLPRGTSVPQPDYIPLAIREDYFEACLIRDDSPKASATLARRCLQGMIRDFCGISKPRLIDEINALRIAVDERTAAAGVTIESVDAIDHVRTIGNIGAHMEADVNLVVSVDAEEALSLITLIEMLLREWYVEKHNRLDRLAAIKNLNETKAAEVAAVKAQIAANAARPMESNTD